MTDARSPDVEIIRIPVGAEDEWLRAEYQRPHASAPSPAVVFLHGFTSNRMEDPVFGLGEGMFERAADAFVRHGRATLRVDFRGHGESDGAFENLTLERLIEDVEAAVAILAERPDVDAKRISLVGHSLGTTAAMFAAQAMPDQIERLVLWHPVPRPYPLFRELLGEDVVSRAFRDGIAEFAWEGKGTFRIGRAFFASLAARSPLAALTSVTAPLLAIYGEHDPYVQPLPWIAYAIEDAHAGPHEHLILKTDHTFSVRTRGTLILDQAIDATVAWISGAD